MLVFHSYVKFPKRKSFDLSFLHEWVKRKMNITTMSIHGFTVVVYEMGLNSFGMIGGIFLDEWGMVLKPLLGNPKLMMGI